MFREPFPPPDYKPVPSKVEGIEVYAPALANAVKSQEVIDFKCAQCGASTAFNVASGGIICSHCGFYQMPDKPVVGHTAGELEFTVETMLEASQGWGGDRKDLECQQCGAHTSVPVENLTHTCPFCGSNKVIQRQEMQEVLRPRFVIPFKVEPSACLVITQKWLGSSWMSPRGLNEVSRGATFTGMYLPYWTFDAVTTAAWKAEVGHSVTRSYYDNGEWKTRSETEWRWESGQVEQSHDDLLEPGTVRLSLRLLKRIDLYDLSYLAPYEPGYLAGLHALAFDIPLEQAWQVGRQRMREKTRQACEKQASSGQVRNFSMNLDFSSESWRYILLPVYITAYRFNNRAYQVVVNGQSGQISGQRPVDWNRIWLVAAALLAPGVLVGLIGLATILLGGVGVAIGLIGLVLLVIGALIAAVIIYQATRLDDI